MGHDASIPGSVHALLWLRVGPELIAEPWQDTDCASIARAAELARAKGRADVGVDGALSLRTTGADLCRDDLWDQVDGLLLAWLHGLQALDAGTPAVTVEFPDTRIEAQLTLITADSTRRVQIRYEDIDAEVAFDALHEALRLASARLVRALGPCTPALAELATLAA